MSEEELETNIGKLTAMGKEEEDFRVKIVLVGLDSVGKTTLSNNFAESMSNPVKTSMDTGINVLTKKMKYNSISIVSQIWDIESQKQLKQNPEEFLKELKGVIYIYDVTNIESLVYLSELVELTRSYLIKHKLEIVTEILVGNKIDVENPVVSIEDIHDFMKTNNIRKHFLTSALSSMNISEPIEYLIEWIFFEFAPNELKISLIENLGEIADEKAVRILTRLSECNEEEIIREKVEEALWKIEKSKEREEVSFGEIRKMLEEGKLAELNKYKGRLSEDLDTLSADQGYEEIFQPLLDCFDWFLEVAQETYYDSYDFFSYFLANLLKDLPFKNHQGKRVVDHILKQPIWENEQLQVKLKHPQYGETQENELFAGVLIGIAKIVSKISDKRMADPLINSMLHCNQLFIDNPSEYYPYGYLGILGTRDVFESIRNSDNQKAERFIEKLIDEIALSEDALDSTIDLLYNIGALAGESVLTALEKYNQNNPDYYREIQLNITRLELLIKKRNLSELNSVITVLLGSFGGSNYKLETIKEFRSKILSINKLDNETKLEIFNLIGGIKVSVILVPLNALFKLETDKDVRISIKKAHDTIHMEFYKRVFIEEEP